MGRHWLPPADEVAPRAWAGPAVVAAASFVATLDAMVLCVAFGSIRRDFPEVSAAALSWILSGYTIVIAAGMIGAGRWADRLGRRRVCRGVAIFVAVVGRAASGELLSHHWGRAHDSDHASGGRRRRHSGRSGSTNRSEGERP